ncbi:nuclear transport factor 2 family protein [Haloplanus pelagicus]|jgi:ketosteroid isomerase-like protein|uniref:nuclear transport factor 2 family protein n=1 Tax=Haloplanus pelagicus TaxID=2949995 RepID=UPI00203D32BF|nr:nuclear transport factor 2 family protein [Haloplanus sp. HW8-1]
MDRRDVVREYYDAIDRGDYERLAALLAPEFVHRRPDRTLEGRDGFVAFMRDDRPRTDTEHVLAEVCGGDESVFARGRLRTRDGDALFGFVDAFRVVDGRIESLTTYTD